MRLSCRFFHLIPWMHHIMHVIVPMEPLSLLYVLSLNKQPDDVLVGCAYALVIRLIQFLADNIIYVNLLLYMGRK